jgi:hypothetical protein
MFEKITGLLYPAIGIGALFLKPGFIAVGTLW